MELKHICSVVRQVQNLRPISLCSDMAHLADALWSMRNAALLEKYCGPEQAGGVSDPVSLILSLILLAQLRGRQGLPTYWALLDQRWAFDVADVARMLGSEGCLWMGLGNLSMGNSR